MLIYLIQVALILVIFLIVRVCVFKFERIKHFPKFLDYQPWNCELCLTFWTLIAIYAFIGIINELYLLLIGGVILAILNAIAMKINEKKNKIIV